MSTVVNNSASPVMLEEGTVIGAAYTQEARHEGVTLSEEDYKRYLRPDCLVVVVESFERVTLDLPAAPIPPQADSSQSTDAPPAQAETGRRDSK